jgi:hypothetical protein
MDGWICGQKRCLDGWMNRRKEGWADGWMGRWMDGWMDEQKIAG